MVKRIIIAGILGLYLCAPHIQAEDIPAQAPSCQMESTDPKANESTPDSKSEPVHVCYTVGRSFNDRCIQFLIAFCVDLAFMVYERSGPQDVR